MSILISSAQDNNDLTMHAPFFKTQIPAFQKWLDNTGLAPVISIGYKNDTLKVRPEFLTLYLKISSKETWDKLDQKVDSTYGTSLPHLLLNKLNFLMDTPDSIGKLTIDAGKHLIKIEYAKDSIRKVVSTKMGASTSFNVPIGNLTNIGSHSVNKVSSVAFVKKALLDELKLFFEQYKEESQFYTFQYEHSGKSENELELNIFNVKNIVLNDDSFEFIEIKFSIQPANGMIKVKYDLNCKYAKGLLWAPHESRYESIDMLVGTNNRFKYFDTKLYEKIQQILGL